MLDWILVKSPKINLLNLNWLKPLREWRVGVIPWILNLNFMLVYPLGFPLDSLLAFVLERVVSHPWNSFIPNFLVGVGISLKPNIQSFIHIWEMKRMGWGGIGGRGGMSEKTDCFLLLCHNDLQTSGIELHLSAPFLVVVLLCFRWCIFWSFLQKILNFYLKVFPRKMKFFWYLNFWTLFALLNFNFIWVNSFALYDSDVRRLLTSEVPNFKKILSLFLDFRKTVSFFVDGNWRPHYSISLYLQSKIYCSRFLIDLGLCDFLGVKFLDKFVCCFAFLALGRMGSEFPCRSDSFILSAFPYSLVFQYFFVLFIKPCFQS